MKIKYYILAVFIAFAALGTGCDDRPTPDQVPMVNMETLSKSGELVGHLPDGSRVTRWEVWDPNGGYIHYIYVVDGTATSVSTNRLEQHGKIHTVKTDSVIIDGVEYAPKQ